jgi:hypothetical protein
MSEKPRELFSEINEVFKKHFIREGGDFSANSKYYMSLMYGEQNELGIPKEIFIHLFKKGNSSEGLRFKVSLSDFQVEGMLNGSDKT